MNKKNISGILTLVLGCALASYAASIPLASATTLVPDQPYMQEALRDLQNAKRELQEASPNKGGYRANAIGLVSRAIVEVNKGIAFDRRNSHAAPSSSSAVDQPKMRAALGYLQSAKKNLEKASADKGGHRVKALDLVDQAIDAVNRGIAIAN